MNAKKRLLITICARGGSKGLPGKNVRPLLGKPLIAHTIEQARAFAPTARIVVSTDSPEIADVSRAYGAETPFVRPAELATDSAGKIPVIVHAVDTCEQLFGEQYDVIVDLDPTAPFRASDDIERGFRHFLETKPNVCFSVVKARKNPYFNMVERAADGSVALVKSLGTAPASRQAAPKVWDMNASIYVYDRAFLATKPTTLWSGTVEMFEMAPVSAFDIDEERDFVVTEALMKYFSR